LAATWVGEGENQRGASRGRSEAAENNRSGERGGLEFKRGVGGFM